MLLAGCKQVTSHQVQSTLTQYWQVGGSRICMGILSLIRHLTGAFMAPQTTHPSRHIPPSSAFRLMGISFMVDISLHLLLVLPLPCWMLVEATSTQTPKMSMSMDSTSRPTTTTTHKSSRLHANQGKCARAEKNINSAPRGRLNSGRLA